MRTLGFVAELKVYSPTLKRELGSLKASILMQYLETIFSLYGDGFAKFSGPSPKNPCYENGCSFFEELEFSEEEFRSAFDVIGVRHKSRTSFERAREAGRQFIGEDGVERYYCSYFDRRLGLTFYFRNHQHVERLIDRLLTISAKVREPGIVSLEKLDKVGFCKPEIPASVNRESRVTETGKVGLQKPGKSGYRNRESRVTEEINNTKESSRLEASLSSKTLTVESQVEIAGLLFNNTNNTKDLDLYNTNNTKDLDHKHKQQHKQVDGGEPSHYNQVKDWCYKEFDGGYERLYSMSYSSSSRDWKEFRALYIRIEQMVERGKISWDQFLSLFSRAALNFFNSELGQHRFWDLCARFDSFQRHPLDRFGKPRQQQAKPDNGKRDIGMAPGVKRRILADDGTIKEIPWD
ncbi:MAG: hypothetical protein V2G41_09425 [bacterium JZ-2024 1]